MKYLVSRLLSTCFIVKENKLRKITEAILVLGLPKFLQNYKLTVVIVRKIKQCKSKR